MGYIDITCYLSTSNYCTSKYFYCLTCCRNSSFILKSSHLLFTTLMLRLNFFFTNSYSVSILWNSFRISVSFITIPLYGQVLFGLSFQNVTIDLHNYNIWSTFYSLVPFSIYFYFKLTLLTSIDSNLLFSSISKILKD